jgi:hypothetical protein
MYRSPGIGDRQPLGFAAVAVNHGLSNVVLDSGPVGFCIFAAIAARRVLFDPADFATETYRPTNVVDMTALAQGDIPSPPKARQDAQRPQERCCDRAVRALYHVVEIDDAHYVVGRDSCSVEGPPPHRVLRILGRRAFPLVFKIRYNRASLVPDHAAYCGNPSIAHNAKVREIGFKQFARTPMTATPAIIPLRLAAQRLAKARKLKKKLAIPELLSLLQSGELAAGFIFPGRDQPRWISIPNAYWLTIDTRKFRALGYERDNPRRPGTFKVRIGPFAKQLIAAIKSDARQTAGKAAFVDEEIEHALTVSAQRYEVVIEEPTWTSYLQRHDLDEKGYQKAKSGRHPLEGWNHVAVLIGIYLLKHHTLSKDIKIKHAGEDIHKLGMSKSIRSLPSVGSIQAALSEISAGAER